MLDLTCLPSPILFRGDEKTAYRDPAVIYQNGVFHLFYTHVSNEPEGKVFLQTALTRSSDLLSWSEPQFLTPRDPALNYSSPGNIIRFNNKWLLSLQTYPRQNGEKYANDTARVFTMSSEDLLHWEEPVLLKVKGNDIPQEKMGRMIDPYLLEDKDEPGKWWCFYKQNGVSMSWSRDLEEWHFHGHAEAGENVCVLTENGEYILFHSPENGIGIKRSQDLLHWKDEGLILLGQKNWPWAQGRLTAGFVLDLRNERSVGKYLMFFHGSGPENEQVYFDTHASIGIAWSDDLKNWNWPK